MKYRALDPLGDYMLGKPLLVNTPEAVGQAVYTRLKLWREEWFLDTTEGTPYNEEVLGKRDGRIPDAAIQQRILGTTGLTAITSYSSSYDGETRTLTVNAAIDTIYGPTTVTVTL